MNTEKLDSPKLVYNTLTPMMVGNDHVIPMIPDNTHLTPMMVKENIRLINEFEDLFAPRFLGSKINFY